MKVLYVASKATTDADLSLTREITELQKRLGAASADPVEFNILPNIRVENLPGELSRFHPDILHVAAHSDKEALSLSDEAGNQVKVTAKMLGVFLPPEHPPRIVYLNSCDSREIARELVDIRSATMAIGSTAPISNRAARASAVAFYECLLAGLTVARAYATGKGMLEALTRSTASMELFPIGCKQAQSEIMNPVPALLADISTQTANKWGEYGFRLGLSGSPASTNQVTFVTDDEDFIQSENEDDLEEDLCLVVRTMSVKGMLWAEEDTWWAAGDHRLFAVGTKAGGGCFAVEGTLCQALERRYRLGGRTALPKTVSRIIEELRKNNGAELDPAVWDSRRSSNNRKSENKKKKGSKKNVV
jgi:hypothetical protein